MNTQRGYIARSNSRTRRAIVGCVWLALFLMTCAGVSAVCVAMVGVR